MLKTNILGAIMLLFVTFPSFAQSVEATFDYKTYYVHEKGTLLEAYINFNGKSLTYRPTSDGYHQGQVNVIIIIKQGTDVLDFSKTDLLSPEITEGSYVDFIEIQKFLLDNGNYQIEIQIDDLYDNNDNKIEFEQPIRIRTDKDDCFISDLQFVAAYGEATEESEMTKSGMDILPYVSTYYSSDFNELAFYAEVYNTDKRMGASGKYLLKYFIEDTDNELVAANISKAQRKNVESVSSLLAKLDISELNSGTYNLVVEVRDPQNELIAQKKQFFRRSNLNIPLVKSEEEINQTFIGKLSHKDSIQEYIYSLRPIADMNELYVLDNGLDSRKLIELKSFFYSFWEKRSPIDPSKAWQDYHAEVLKAEESFGTRIKKGYETDRGRVYLKYGAPNTINSRANDQESYPYEIWHYYKAAEYNNKRFVFYDRELMMQDYELLHSDVPGEIRNPRWNLVINSRNTPMNNLDDTKSNSRSSDRLEDDYKIPN